MVKRSEMGQEPVEPAKKKRAKSRQCEVPVSVNHRKRNQSGFILQRKEAGRNRSKLGSISMCFEHLTVLVSGPCSSEKKLRNLNLLVAGKTEDVVTRCALSCHRKQGLCASSSFQAERGCKPGRPCGGMCVSLKAYLALNILFGLT